MNTRRIGLLTLSALLMASATQAAEFTPKNADELAQAIATANGNGEADTIRLDKINTYRLTKAASGGNGLPNITSDMTIEGEGATIARDVAAPEFRFFTVNSQGILRLKQIVLRGGRAPGSQGGCLDNQSGTIEITASTLTDCQASSGGAINTVNGTLTIRQSALHNNAVSVGGRGGAVFVSQSQVTIVNTTLALNDATGAWGGAIAALTGTVNISFSTVVQNRSDTGGGIARKGTSTINLRGTILSQNVADTGPDCSGAFTSMDYNIVGVTEGCTIADAGHDTLGIDPGTIGLSSFIDQSGNPAKSYLPVLDQGKALDQVMQCTAIGGASVQVDQLGDRRDIKCDIGAMENACGDQLKSAFKQELCDDGNVTDGDGCSSVCKPHMTLPVTTTADENDGACTAGHCSLREAILMANTGYDNTAITLPAGTYLFTKADVGTDLQDTNDHDVRWDMAIVGAGETQTIIDGADLTRLFELQPTSNPFTGFSKTPTLTLRDLTLQHGNAGSTGSENLGGAINNFFGGTLTLERVRCLDNKAWSGGALYSTGPVTISHAIFNNNTSPNDGGAIAMGTQQQQTTLPRLTITDSVFTENTVTGAGNEGGAISGQNSHIVIERSTLAHNTAQGPGGALSGTGSGSLTLRNVVVDHNASILGSGGGLYYSDVTIDIANTTFFGNEAGGYGGAINGTKTSQPITIRHATIAGNQADLAIGAIAFDKGTPTIHNTFIMGNTAPEHPNCSKSLSSLGHNLVATGCLPAENTVGDLVKETVPLGTFVTGTVAGAGYIPLLDGNVGINAGDPAGCTAALKTDTDQLGHARVGTCDIGAVESYCGDGTMQSANTEQCDDGNTTNTDACLNSCVKAGCGDGVEQAGVETCDDGNTIDNDGCPNSCKSPTCGDTIVQAAKGEDCDDGNQDNTDVCLNSCAAAKCGDGIVHAGTEACDDGNQDNTDACLNSCAAAKCGDGIVRTGAEACDDGNANDTDTCSNSCTVVIAAAPATAPASGPATAPPPTTETTGATTATTTGNTTTTTETPAASASGGGCSVIVAP